MSDLDVVQDLIYDALTHMAPGDALDITAHDLAQDILDRLDRKIEILHVRDPDEGCFHDVFVGGKLVRTVPIEDVDGLASA